MALSRVLHRAQAFQAQPKPTGPHAVTKKRPRTYSGIDLYRRHFFGVNVIQVKSEDTRHQMEASVGKATSLGISPLAGFQAPQYVSRTIWSGRGGWAYRENSG